MHLFRFCFADGEKIELPAIDLETVTLIGPLTFINFKDRAKESLRIHNGEGNALVSIERVNSEARR